jgi:Bax protein
MKYLYILMLLSLSLFASELKTDEAEHVTSTAPKNISVSAKKERFYALLVPVVKRVHNELKEQHKKIFWDLFYKRNSQEIAKLKEVYKVNSDRELLVALKPHQISIALAQAAMESSWATSRFFTQANNIFGMWSSNTNEPRIAALEERNGTQTIWLRKFSTAEESIREYYKLLARGKAYKEFREVKYESNDVFKIVKKLDKYSELDEKYTKELASMIRYNKLTKYD